jgi:hypothetical protein
MEYAEYQPLAQAQHCYGQGHIQGGYANWSISKGRNPYYFVFPTYGLPAMQLSVHNQASPILSHSALSHNKPDTSSTWTTNRRTRFCKTAWHALWQRQLLLLSRKPMYSFRRLWLTTNSFEFCWTLRLFTNWGRDLPRGCRGLLKIVELGDWIVKEY